MNIFANCLAVCVGFPHVLWSRNAKTELLLVTGNFLAKYLPYTVVYQITYSSVTTAHQYDLISYNAFDVIYILMLIYAYTFFL